MIWMWSTIDAELEGAQVVGRREGRVDDHLRVDGAGRFDDARDVAEVEVGIGRHLEQHDAGARPDRLDDARGVDRWNLRALDTETREDLLAEL